VNQAEFIYTRQHIRVIDGRTRSYKRVAQVACYLYVAWITLSGSIYSCYTSNPSSIHVYIFDHESAY